jgi:hypothetical protein
MSSPKLHPKDSVVNRARDMVFRQFYLEWPNSKAPKERNAKAQGNALGGPRQSIDKSPNGAK